jgi:K+-transporting ATPase ATPase C chain
MLKEAIKTMQVASKMLLMLTLLTGLIYPLLVTFFAQLFFPWQANGSLVKDGARVVGSLHIGQWFSSPRYFMSRPSATTPFPYHGEASRASNLGPSNPVFLETVQARINQLKQLDMGNRDLIPVDLVTASASGLDPDISPYAAFYQVPRIARLRKLPEVTLNQLISEHLKNRPWFVLGEPRLNVLTLNIALDKLS